MPDINGEYQLMRTIHEHRDRVSFYIDRVIRELMDRSLVHDDSKFGKEEFPVFAKAIHKFKNHPFGSAGYAKAKESILPGTEHHFKMNRHHPEHFPNGINDMNLIDLLEMLCDWKAATLNHKEAPGDIHKSIQFGIDKYKISPQLAKVLYNTIRDLKF